MTILQVVYDPKFGVAVADGRIPTFVEDMLRMQAQAGNQQYVSVVVGTESMLDAFHLKYLQLWKEGGKRPQIEFIENECKVEVTRCGHLNIPYERGVHERQLLEIMDLRDAIIDQHLLEGTD